MSVLYFVRGTAALDLEAGSLDASEYPQLLSRLMDAARFPALAAAVAAGVFDGADDDPRADLDSGLQRLLDGIGVEVANTEHRPADGIRYWDQQQGMPSPG